MHLFITSAKEGLNEEELSKYPLSGCVFVKEMSLGGSPSIPYRYEV